MAPQSEVIMAKAKPIGYREQSLKCDKSGNRIRVACIRCSQLNLICVKYACCCHSKACLEERTNG